MDIIDMPVKAVAREYGRLMDLYYGNPSHRNWHKTLTTEVWKHHDTLSNSIEKIWLEYPDELVAFETRLRLGVK